ncbi:MAG: tetratricopeptide repeat protein, partial [Proteobacteria bacterium]|nr:tetratricopeptide repeat protein [Pseudomonadota bacterium]
EAMKDPTPQAHRIASFIHITQNQYDDAMAEAQRAIDLDPNDPIGYEAMAWVLIHVGRPAESLEFIERAERLDPRSGYLYRVGEAQFHQERYEEAVETMLKHSESHPDSVHRLLYLAAAYGHLGREEESRAAIDTFKKEIQANMGTGVIGTIDQVGILRFKDGGIEDLRLREGLRKVGFDASPEVVNASSEEITLKKPADGTVTRVYEVAREHCRKHGKESSIMNSTYPRYVFSCR